MVGGGSCASGPSGEGCVGRVKSAARRVCAPSRASDCKWASRSALDIAATLGGCISLTVSDTHL